MCYQHIKARGVLSVPPHPGWMEHPLTAQQAIWHVEQKLHKYTSQHTPPPHPHSLDATHPNPSLPYPSQHPQTHTHLAAAKVHRQRLNTTSISIDSRTLCRWLHGDEVALDQQPQRLVLLGGAATRHADADDVAVLEQGLLLLLLARRYPLPWDWRLVGFFLLLLVAFTLLTKPVLGGAVCCLPVKSC